MSPSGSAKEDSAWREILGDNFSSAAHIGLTATLKRRKTPQILHILANLFIPIL